MSSTLLEKLAFGQPAASFFARFCIGRILGVTHEGRALVDYPGSRNGPVEARSAVEVTGVSPQRLKGAPVVLLLLDEEPAPIIIGLLRDQLCSGILQPDVSEIMGRAEECTVDGERVRIEGKQAVLIRCGKASIELMADGRILIRGARLVSRAEGLNAIKGASVRIN